MWIHGSRSFPPASSSSTDLFPSAVRRLASTQPAEPAPTTMKSNVWASATAFPPDRVSIATMTASDASGQGQGAYERVNPDIRPLRLRTADAQRFHQQREGRRWLTAAGVVEVVTGEWRAP